MANELTCALPLLSDLDEAASRRTADCLHVSETVCGSLNSLKILEEFQNIYEERLRKVDETGGEGLELKLKILTSWINDLAEQNLVLVESVEQLEREAAERVTLLESRLRKSSHIALDYLSKLEECNDLISEEGFIPTKMPMNELECKMVDLETTYLRLEKSWDYAWQTSKDADVAEQTIWCTPGVMKDQQKIRELCRDVLHQLRSSPQSNHSFQKRSVGFECPSKPDMKPRIQAPIILEQTPLVEKQLPHNMEIGNDEHRLARQIEECRINVVLAQAAVEEILEELEGIANISHEREEKMCEMELLTQSVKINLIHFQQDINVMKKPTGDNTGLEHLEFVKMQEKLNEVHFGIHEACKKIDTYEHQKRTFLERRVKKEKKIKKLLLELETIQEGLEQCLKTFESSNLSDSDVE